MDGDDRDFGAVIRELSSSVVVEVAVAVVVEVAVAEVEGDEKGK